MTMKSFDASLPGPEDTDRLGLACARALRTLAAEVAASGFALRLEGDLGAGKTSLTRALLRGMGWTGAVKSPTFSLLETYAFEGFTLNHFDFYRFEEPMEFEDAGFRDQYGPGNFSVSEWSSKAAPYLPAADLVVALTVDGYGRKAQLAAETPLGERFLACIEKAWNAAA